jgi:hypothetical protein
MLPLPQPLPPLRCGCRWLRLRAAAEALKLTLSCGSIHNHRLI